MDDYTFAIYKIIALYLNGHEQLMLSYTCKKLHNALVSEAIKKIKKEKRDAEFMNRLSYIYLKNRIGQGRKELYKGKINLKIFDVDNKTQFSWSKYALIHGITIVYKEKPKGYVNLVSGGHEVLRYFVEEPLRLDNDFYVFTIPYFLYGTPFLLKDFFMQVEINSEEPMYKIIISYDETIHAYFRSVYTPVYDITGFNVIVNKHGICTKAYGHGQQKIKDLDIQFMGMTWGPYMRPG